MKQRTKYLILVLLFLSGWLFSCSKDDSQESKNCSLKNQKKMPYNFIGSGIFTDPLTGQIIDGIDFDKFTRDNPIFQQGIYYNYFVGIDARKLTSSDEWIVPANTQRDVLIAFLGGTTVAGGKLKQTGTTTFAAPNTGATNESGFTAKGYGKRQGGTFQFLNANTTYWCSSQANASLGHAITNILNTAASCSATYDTKDAGNKIRLVYIGGGNPTEYTGNNGIKYPVVKIGTQYWTLEDLNETQYRNKEFIHGFEGGIYRPITNAVWTALTTEAGCYWMDNKTTAIKPTATPTTMAIDKITVNATDRKTGITTNIDISNHVTEVKVTTPGETKTTSIDSFFEIPPCSYKIDFKIDTPIQNIIDPKIYSKIEIVPIYIFKDEAYSEIPLLTTAPSGISQNLFFESTGITTGTSNILIIDTMILADFKKVAADRLGCEPSKVRVKTKVLNFDTEAGTDQTTNLYEIDNRMTTGYIKNVELINKDEANAGNIVSISDNYSLATFKPIVWASTGKAADKGTNFFCDKVRIQGGFKGQIIAYIAERMY